MTAQQTEIRRGQKSNCLVSVFRKRFEWSSKRDQASRQREQLWAEIQARGRAGRRHEVLLTAGQTSGGIKTIQPLAEILRPLIEEASAHLSRAPGGASGNDDSNFSGSSRTN